MSRNVGGHCLIAPERTPRWLCRLVVLPVEYMKGKIAKVLVFCSWINNDLTDKGEEDWTLTQGLQVFLQRGSYVHYLEEISKSMSRFLVINFG